MSRLLIVLFFPTALLAAPEPVAPPRQPTLSAGSHTMLAQNTARQRRRRKRPKRRSSDYEIIEVHNGGTIEGIVRFKGKVPPPKKIQVVKDHATCDSRDKIRPRIKVDDQQQVEEAVVFLGNIRAGKAVVPPTEKPVIDQRTCTFRPHVQVLVKDQPFEIINSDPLAHSAHLTQHRKSVYNRMQPQQGMRSELTISDVGLATLKCDVHDWMRAYVYVVWHPYYAVTGTDGIFRLVDVPPGEYELVVWQEYVGEHTQTVVVESGKVANIIFEIAKD